MRRGSAALAVVVALVGIGVVAIQSLGDTAPPTLPAVSTDTVTTTTTTTDPGSAGFADEFDGTALDTNRWGTCHWWDNGGCTVTGGNEEEWFLPEQVAVSGGVLRLTADRREFSASDGKTHPYVSGMISSGAPDDESSARYSFLYGRAEMRARIPSGKGFWSGFWLLPASLESTPEIDIFEILGGTPSTVRMHLHAKGGIDIAGRNWVGPDLSNGWHTYAVDWKPGVMRWLVDGVERWSVTGDTVPSEPMYLIANLAVGGDYPGSPNDQTRFPSALEIDSIRVISP